MKCIVDWNSLKKFTAIVICTWLFFNMSGAYLIKAQNKYDYPIISSFRNFTTEDGLPSNEVYQVVQDYSGYLWIATDRGVARYNGSVFKTYGIDEGLMGTSVFGFKFDRHKVLWCYNYQFEVYSFDGKRFNRHPVSDSLKEYRFKINDIYWQEDTLWVSTHHKIFKAYPDGKIVSMPFLTDEPYYLSIYKINDTSYAVAYPPPDRLIEGFAYHDGNKVQITHLEKDIYIYYSYLLMFTGGHDGVLYLVFGDYLIVKKGDKYTFHKNRYFLNHALYFDHQNRFWTGNSHGASMYELPNLDKPKSVFLEDYIITSCFQDKEHGYWFTTKGFGLFHLPRIELQTFENNDPDKKIRIKSLGILGDTVVFNDFDSMLYYIKMPTGKINSQAFNYFDNAILNTTKYNRLYLLKGGLSQLIFEKNRFRRKYFKKIAYPALMYDESALYPKRISDDTNIVFYQKSIWDPTVMPLVSFSRLNFRYRHFYISSGYLYMADRFGMDIYNRETGEFLTEVYGTLTSRINGLTGNDTLVIVATSGAGVLVCQGTKILNHIRRDNGLTDDQCNDVFLSDNGKLWVSTNNGLSMISDAWSPERYKITNYTIGQGLPSRQIHSAIARNGWVALRTSSAVSYFYEKDFNDIHPDFPVYITNFEIQRQNAEHFDTTELSYDQNNIFIEYEAVTFQFANELRFRYRLLGLDTSWRYTADLSVEYNSLPPGDYSFQLQGGTSFHGWSNQITEAQFRIIPPFWTTWWFIGLCVLLVIEILFLIVSRRIKVLSRRQRIENRLFFYRQQAIGLQMNPHFLFNSVGSIQAHILNNDQKSLLRHLASFAKLIRLIFEISKKNLVSLNDEIKVLQHYLEFEKLRFKEKLDYQFNIDPNLDMEATKVPPLLIQPLIENAVKHGRNVDDGKGQITINIKKRNTSLIFEVHDNGKGFDQAPAAGGKNKLQMHVSAGLSLVRKRLNLLEEWIRKPTRLQIISGDDNKNQGTLVIVEVPILTNTPEE